MKSLKEAVFKAVFANEAHEAHYRALRLEVLGDHADEYTDAYREVLCYLIALNEDTYRHRADLYSLEERSIIPEGINKEWQTSSSLKVCRLAFNLFTAGCMWCDEGTERYCAVDEIFSCNYAPYFMEAVKIAMYSVF